VVFLSAEYATGIWAVPRTKEKKRGGGGGLLALEEKNLPAGSVGLGVSGMGCKVHLKEERGEGEFSTFGKN